MSRLRVLWVGRTDKGFPREGVAHYERRIRPLVPLECIEVKAADHSGRNRVQALAAEADALLRRLGAGDTVVLLDERGAQPTSRELAGWLDALEQGPMAFVIGGAYGVDPAVRRRARRVLSLSRLTLPHQLVRIVLLEQLYRALTIRAGHGYHHG